MTVAQLIRRVSLCCLALCVAGTGLSTYAFRAAEAEVEVKAEEVATHVASGRRNVGLANRATSTTSAVVPPKGSPAAQATSIEVAENASLRALNVRIQV